MHYSVEVIERAREEIKLRRESAVNERNRRISEIRVKAPEIAKLVDELPLTSLKLTQAIIGGADNSKELIEKIKNENLETQKTIRKMLCEFSYPEDYFEFHYTCPLCKDNGSVLGRNCSCYEELLMKYAVEELNAKSKITLHDFDEFRLEYYPTTQISANHTVRNQMLAVYEYCYDYAKNFNTDSPSLILTGATGLGKTFLSSAIAKVVSQNGFSVVFDSVSGILGKIEDEHFGRSEGSTLQLILNADLVILDDVGSEFITNFTSSTLYDILNTRMNCSFPTIVSTNFSNAELDMKYNERIISRISSFIPIHFAGNDIRQIILKNNY